MNKKKQTNKEDIDICTKMSKNSRVKKKELDL